mmetsp:Transcript_15926/g.37989  ORF Transcript_15926/g.37989 Transcript_15926/m.37989 type:complete len:247 (-) Transcript_15926:1163-1903(-)
MSRKRQATYVHSTTHTTTSPTHREQQQPPIIARSFGFHLGRLLCPLPPPRHELLAGRQQHRHCNRHQHRQVNRKFELGAEVEVGHHRVVMESLHAILIPAPNPPQQPTQVPLAPLDGIQSVCGHPQDVIDAFCDALLDCQVGQAANERLDRRQVLADFAQKELQKGVGESQQLPRGYTVSGWGGHRRLGQWWRVVVDVDGGGRVSHIRKPQPFPKVAQPQAGRLTRIGIRQLISTASHLSAPCCVA